MRQTWQSTSQLPFGSLAVDRNGDGLIVWPNGTYGYDAEHRHTDRSSSTGPYEVRAKDLDIATCDALAQLDRRNRVTHARVAARILAQAARCERAMRHEPDRVDINSGRIEGLYTALNILNGGDAE